VLDDGRISYRIKDTDQVRLMTPVQFLARLAALVPPPRHPLPPPAAAQRRTRQGDRAGRTPSAYD
jgi:hypothetical protein